MKSKFVMTNNAKNFITLTNNLLNRGKNVSGMALVYGEPGVGKSHTALWWVANNDNAIHVQVTQTMTPRWLLSEIVKELGEYPAARTSDLFNQIVKSLILDPKILMIDEVDYLIDKRGFIEILRDIYDRTKTPIIMIGMGVANKKLEQYKHFKDRLLAFLRFKPFELKEIDLFIKELSEVNFSPEAIDFLYKMKVGFRQIVNIVRGLFHDKVRERKRPSVILDGEDTYGLRVSKTEVSEFRFCLLIEQKLSLMPTI